MHRGNGSSSGIHLCTAPPLTHPDSDSKYFLEDFAAKQPDHASSMSKLKSKLEGYVRCPRLKAQGSWGGRVSKHVSPDDLTVHQGFALQ